ncbi:MAG: twin-arginine translocase subunit TatB [Sphingomonadales bacterium]|nr:twin-arginine translocase subunit TatB [Sphingomonadales bacterium]MBD3773705.1 twin-arginine translocase subunit TatB [Paracoccaceae bacterium]
MFDVGASELLVIVIVAIIVIGPKDMPLALRTAGRWIGKMRRMSAHFRSGIDAMIREAELADMEQKWQEQNARIMAQHPQAEMTELEKTPPVPQDILPDAAKDEGAAPADAAAASKPEPELPLDGKQG